MRISPAVILAVLVVAAVALIGGSATGLNVATTIGIYSLLALSIGLSYGQAGILSVAQGSFAAVGAYATAILTTHYDLPVVMALPVAILSSGVLGYCLARLVLHLSPLALAIATLLFSNVVDLLIRNGGDFTGGYIGLSGIPPLERTSSPFILNVTVWAIVIIVVVLYDNMVRSGFGRALSVVRHDTLRAAADGIEVVSVQRTVFALSSALAGLAGWLYAIFLSYVGPESLGLPVSLSVLLMAVIGGSRSVLGPIFGAVILTLINNMLPGQQSKGMIYGGILILVMLLAPAGLTGAFHQLFAGLRRGLSGNTRA